MSTDIRDLPVKLTDAEMIVKGQELAELENELRSLEDKKRETSKEFSGQLEAMRKKIADTAHEINTKQEFRDVEVETVRDEKELTIMVVRLDTGEIVSKRLMSNAERQPILKFTGIKEVEKTEKEKN